MRLVKDRVFSDILNILPYLIYVCVLTIYVFSQYVYCVLRPEWRALSTELQRSGARRSGGFWLSGVGPPPSKPYPRHTRQSFSRYFPLKIELLPRLRLGVGSIQA